MEILAKDSLTLELEIVNVTGRQQPRGRAFISAVGMVGAIVLGILGFVALASLRPAPEQIPPQQKRYNVDVFTVQRVCLRETISGFGTVLPDREVTLSAQVAGEIQEHQLEVGHSIRETDPVLEIDPRIYRQRHEQVKAELVEGDTELSRIKQEQINANRLLTKATADFETASQQYQRRKALQSREIVTTDELSRALLELKQYEEALIRQENDAALYPLKLDQIEKRQLTTKIALALAQLDLDHTQVVPPFAGVISEVHVETGQYVRVGDPLIGIINQRSVEIPVSIKLSDYEKVAGSIARGEFPQVQLAMDVSAAAQWNGRLTRAAPKANRENRTIEVYVEVDNAQQATPLLPGSFVHARIEGPLLENVFAIPRDAIINRHVLIANSGKNSELVQRQIEPTQTLEDLAILETGLNDGDELILTNLDVLYRDPDASKDQQQRVLLINRKHDLKEYVDGQARKLVTILECESDTIQP